MRKTIFILMLAISFQSFSQEWFAFGYKTLDDGTNLPNNWSQESTTGDALWYGYGGLYTPYEGGGNKYFCVWDAVGNDIGEEAIIITQEFSNTGISNSFVGFWHTQVDFGGDNNELEVYYRTSSTSSWVLLEAFTEPIADWTEEQLFFPEQSATMQVGFKGILVGGDNTQGVALDYIYMQYYENSCFAPSNLSVTNATTTTALVNWDENGTSTTWDIEYGDYGYTQGTGTAINGINTTPTHTITGLTVNNQYDVYVRADCGAMQSDWTGPFSFYTECESVSSFPYTEAFDNSNFDNEDWNVGFTVNCWTEEQGTIAEPTSFSGADADFRPGEFGVPGDYLPATSNAAVARLSFGDSWLISPNFNLGTSNNYQLEFDIAATHYNGPTPCTLTNTDTVAIVVSTDGGATWNKSNILKYWDATTNPSEITVAGIHNIVNLGAYTGEVKIAFYVSGEGAGSSGHIFIDNPRITTFATTPILEVLEPNTWNAGPQLINGTDTSGMVFSIRNSGVGTLTINSITDLSLSEFTTNFNSAITLDSAEVHTFSFNYTPTDLINDSLYFAITTDYGIDSILLKGTAYELASCEIEIGTDVQEINLPLNFNYHNSFSQSLFLQTEIDRDGQEINYVYFYYNGVDNFTNERSFTIFLKHTQLTELTEWEDMAGFDSLSTITLSLEAEGWYGIALGSGFSYNNTDNLIIAIATNMVTGQQHSTQSMHSHTAPNNSLMSMVTYSSMEIDYNNLPIISPIAYRPNVRFCLETTNNVVNPTQNNNTFTVYPNPAQNNIQLTINNNQTNGSVLIIDITGKIVKQQTIESSKMNIQVSDLQNGIYFVRVGSEVKKFIKE